ncbi:MAG: hypothetical protein H6742_10770 [Alphaproteobacteria bacterium]|nr:hypothetical protein [Alphaproteobacteria bacterium]
MSIPTPRLTTLFLGSILSVGLVACTEKDEDEDSDTDTDTTDDTTDTDGGTTDGTGTDGTGTGTGGDDTGLAAFGYAGEAVIGGGYDGYETAYYIGLTDSYLNCLITSDVSGSDLGGFSSCPECEFAFAVSTSGSAFDDSTGCDIIGVTDASAFDGATYGYGYEYYYYAGYGYIGLLKYYYGGTWYQVAYADYDGSNFAYDWFSGYGYYYQP